MRTWLDHYTKSCLRDFLAPTGDVETQHPVAAVDAQWIDIWYEPRPELEEERLHLGWLGRLAEKPCIFEPFCDAPDEEEVRGCLRKVLTKHHRRLLEARRAGQSRPLIPRCWIIAPTISAPMIKVCGFQRRKPWPSGIYLMPSIVGVGWVSLRHLAKNKETLSLRLLAGRGPIFEAAMDDIERLPEGAWEKTLSKEIFLARYEEVINNPSRDTEEQEFMMTVKERYQQWEKQKLEMGMNIGLERGLQQGRETALRSALQRVFQARFGVMPAVLRQALDGEHNPDVLLGWMPLFSVEPYEKIAQALGIELSSAQ